MPDKEPLEELRARLYREADEEAHRQMAEALNTGLSQPGVDEADMSGAIRRGRNLPWPEYLALLRDPRGRRH